MFRRPKSSRTPVQPAGVISRAEASRLREPALCSAVHPQFGICSKLEGHEGRHRQGYTGLAWANEQPIGDRCGARCAVTGPAYGCQCIADLGHEGEHFGLRAGMVRPQFWSDEPVVDQPVAKEKCGATDYGTCDCREPKGHAGPHVCGGMMYDGSRCGHTWATQPVGDRDDPFRCGAICWATGDNYGWSCERALGHSGPHEVVEVDGSLEVPHRWADEPPVPPVVAKWCANVCTKPGSNYGAVCERPPGHDGAHHGHRTAARDWMQPLVWWDDEPAGDQGVSSRQTGATKEAMLGWADGTIVWWNGAPPPRDYRWVPFDEACHAQLSLGGGVSKLCSRAVNHRGDHMSGGLGSIYARWPQDPPPVPPQEEMKVLWQYQIPAGSLEARLPDIDWSGDTVKASLHTDAFAYGRGQFVVGAGPKAAESDTGGQPPIPEDEPSFTDRMIDAMTRPVLSPLMKAGDGLRYTAEFRMPGAIEEAIARSVKDAAIAEHEEARQEAPRCEYRLWSAGPRCELGEGHGGAHRAGARTWVRLEHGLLDLGPAPGQPAAKETVGATILAEQAAARQAVFEEAGFTPPVDTNTFTVRAERPPVWLTEEQQARMIRDIIKMPTPPTEPVLGPEYDLVGDAVSDLSHELSDLRYRVARLERRLNAKDERKAAKKAKGPQADRPRPDTARPDRY